MDNIAREAGVSKSLVSRALSGKYGVSDEKRHQITLAAFKMGYQFSQKSSNSRPMKMESVSIVVTKMDLIDKSFTIKIVNYMEYELKKKGISVFLSIINGKEDFDIPISIQQMKTNGLLLLGDIPLDTIVKLCTTGLPIVMVDVWYLNVKLDNVMANNFTGAFEVTEYLINMGHRKIAFVGSPEYSFSFVERHRGYLECMQLHREKGTINYEATDTFEDHFTPFSPSSFREILRKTDRPTAIVAANDPVAFKLYQILDKEGLKIPGDISIVGFDNVEKCDWVKPKLTSVNISKETIAKRAIDLLLTRIREPEENREMVLVNTNLIERDSVASLE